MAERDDRSRSFGREGYYGRDKRRDDDDDSWFGFESDRASDRDGMWGSRFQQPGRERGDQGYGNYYGGGYGGYGGGYESGRYGRDSQMQSRDGGQRSDRNFAGRGPKSYRRSDERIKEDVCERLARHHDIDASEVEIEVKEGEVTLSGSVEDRRMKRLIEDETESVWGVKDVSNRIRVGERQEASASATTPSKSGNGSATKQSRADGGKDRTQLPT